MADQCKQGVADRNPGELSTRVVIPELRLVPRYNAVLAEHLGSVVAQTEQAAYDITARLVAIDDEASRLLALVEASAASPADQLCAGLHALQDALAKDGAAPGDLLQTLAPLVQYSEALRARERETLAVIESSAEALASMFVDTLASVQFQDVTRQQIEQVVGAMKRMEGQMLVLANLLEDPEQPDQENALSSLAEHLDELFTNYVMDQQRDSHQQALTGQADSQSAAPEATAAPSKVELF